MRALTSLDLDFKRTLSTLETLNKCGMIYTYCNQLRSFAIGGNFNASNIISFVQNLAEQVKLKSRTSQFTLILGTIIEIKTIAAIQQIVEAVSEILIVEYRYEKDSNNFIEVLPLIKKDKHPILHKFISMKGSIEG